jgi:aryl-alcohol dehydrogenase-like predicted oxidoreductase
MWNLKSGIGGKMTMNFSAHTTLGRTGLSVSRLGIGTYGAPADALERAFHNYGINYFYRGPSKGQPMRDAFKGLPRDEIVIALPTYAKYGAFMRHFLEKRLRAIGTDHIDLFILSWMRGEPQGRMLELALKLKEEGKVRYLAVSTHNRPLAGKIAADPATPIDALMVRYNAAHTGAEKDIFPLFPPTNRPGLIAFTATRWGQLMQAKRMPAGEKPLTASDCYRFALTNGYMNLCMTGPRTADELDENVKTLELGPLSDEEMERVRRIGKYVYGK